VARNRRPLERRTLTRIGAIVLAIALLGGLLATRRVLQRKPPAPVAERPDVTAPDGERVRVEVLNATTVRGLARRAMLHLRDRGFDVLELGTSQEQRDSTLVLDRSGHPDWARRVADALGGARVESRPDTSRYLDVTVLLGRSWRPPAEPFYP
jgi:hypothetical protein